VSVTCCPLTGGDCMEGLSPAAKGRLFERRMAWLEATS